MTILEAMALPVVVKVHGSDILRLGDHPGRIRPTQDALRQADAVVAVSRDLADKVMEFGVDPKRVHVTYNGVDSRLFYPGPRESARARLGLHPSRPVGLIGSHIVDLLISFRRNQETGLPVDHNLRVSTHARSDDQSSHGKTIRANECRDPPGRAGYKGRPKVS